MLCVFCSMFCATTAATTYLNQDVKLGRHYSSHLTFEPNIRFAECCIYNFLSFVDSFAFVFSFVDFFCNCIFFCWFTTNMFNKFFPSSVGRLRPISEFITFLFSLLSFFQSESWKRRIVKCLSSSPQAELMIKSAIKRFSYPTPAPKENNIQSLLE